MPLTCRILYQDRFADQRSLFEQRLYLIGRDKHCDIVVDDRSVSRRHAHVRYHDGDWLITDLNSTNGCFFDERKISEQIIHERSVIKIGSVSLELQPLTHKQLTTDLQHRAWQHRQLRTIRQDCIQSHDLKRLLTQAQQGAQNILHSERAALILLNDKSRIDQCIGFPDWLEPGHFSGSKTLIKQAINSRSVVAVNNAQTHQHLRDQRSVIEHSIKAAIAVPISYSNCIIGVFYADNVHQHHYFTDHDVSVLSLFAQQLSSQLAFAQIDLQLQWVEERLQQLLAG
ncbi:hypothetical protein CWE22_08805 [Pseudidiomarina aestuarii]|uniref:FHA domain-containing protein n=1 Tax=Pseudidiomarina aestuarii TaxID=624146 RepID=A0A7Z6ZW00_9GAMM|nr:FHA domain-containing protein [Pseudidiomarina aestuarii]RUO42226.1 hypothetical protein CWE22_08805 [Pseudidiomarina aestuarii]